MKKKIVFTVIVIFVLINAILAYLYFRPTVLIPLLTATEKNQVYYYNSTPYPIGSYYLYTNNTRFVFVAKLLDTYENDGNIYAKIQLTKNPTDTQVVSIFLKNGRTRFVDHPFDQLLGVYTESHSQLLDNSQQVLFNATKYKNQNLVFTAPLPSGMKIPTPNDPKVNALMQKPEIITLVSSQKKGADCGNKLLIEFQRKKITSLSCVPYIVELHVNTGNWKPL